MSIKQAVYSTLLLSFLSLGTSAQKKLKLLSKVPLNVYEMQTASADSIVSYKTYMPAARGLYKMEQRNAKTGQLMAEGEVKRINNALDMRMGEYKEYDSAGNKIVEGSYVNKMADGTWTYYFPGTNIVWYTVEKKKGMNDGALTSYYKDGKVKRKEVYKLNKSIGGQCMDESGIEIPFTPFFVEAVTPIEGVNVIAKNLRYPNHAKEEGIEGQVKISLTIKDDGIISDMEFVKKIGGGCDEEAMRVMKLLPTTGWKAAEIDGEVSKTPYIQAISFVLE